jgi:hypothetical protein
VSNKQAWTAVAIVLIVGLVAAIHKRSQDRPLAWDCDQILRETRAFDHTECDMIELRKRCSSPTVRIGEAMVVAGCQ